MRFVFPVGPSVFSAIDELRLLALLSLSIALCAGPIGCKKQEPSPVEHRLFHLAGDPDSPVRFVERLGEFQLVYESVEDGKPIEWSVPLAYSPFTGAPLPSRGRDELFMIPSPDEVNAVRVKLKNARTFSEVEVAFGPPDSTLSGKLTANRKAQYFYTNIAETLDVVVWEYADGTIEFMTYRKRTPQ